MKTIFHLFVLALLVFVSAPMAARAVSLQPYYVEKLSTSESKLYIRDRFGEHYVVEYGPECTVILKYDKGLVYINTTGIFLDGLGDYIYFGNQKEYCRIWSASYVKSGQGYYTIYGAQTVCPDYGHFVPGRPGGCECDTGYEFNFNRSICVPKVVPEQLANNDLCVKTFGLHSMWDGKKLPNNTINCICDTGYEWNSTLTACIPATTTTVTNTPQPIVVPAESISEQSSDQPASISNEAVESQPPKQYVPIYKRFWNWISSLWRR